MNMPLAIILSALTGYLSLTLEILWIRVLSFMTASDPRVFGYVLGFFLTGLALGALAGKRNCQRNTLAPLTFIAISLGLLGVLCFVSVEAIGFLSEHMTAVRLPIAYLMVAAAAFLSGGVFPVISHLGVNSGRDAGYRISIVYFANIAGSTAGPIVTGFVLLDHFPIQQLFFFTGVMLAALSVLLFLASPTGKKLKLTAVSSVLAVCIVFSPAQGDFSGMFLERVMNMTDSPFRHIIQNKSGIITVDKLFRENVLYGHGAYDGKFNTDPHVDINLIRRAYKVAALHPYPAKILQIGLGSGSWTRVLTYSDSVEKIDVIEINPGYVELISMYPEISPILSDPRVSVHIDDGRRWMVRNPGERYDFILMNTTFHWRNFATNLLSEEFLRLAKAHLLPGGVIYYNTTGSEEVKRTAAKVFRHIAVYENFVAASDSPFDMPLEQSREKLLGFKMDGKSIFNINDPFSPGLLHRIASPAEAYSPANTSEISTITDDNMLTEYKKRGRFLNPQKSWAGLLDRLRQ